VENFAEVGSMNCKIRMFEVEKKSFFPMCPTRQQSLTAFGAKFLNFANVRFCTISVHIILGTCMPNLRGRR
jgi:hypothetical protein